MCTNLHTFLRDERNLGDWRQGRVGSVREGFEPGTDGKAKRRDGNTREGVGEFIEAAKSGPQKRAGSQIIAALKMVKGSGYLDESLQESLLRFRRGEPHRFPVLVRFEEFAGMKTTQTFEQISVSPVEWHRQNI